jgi:CHAT domain/SIR2-like domain
MSIAELKIFLSHHEQSAEFDYDVELTFSRSDDDVNPSPVKGKAQIDLRRIYDKTLADDAYGRLLTESLFSDQNIRTYFDRVCGISQAANAPLRIQLAIGSDAAELNCVYWERLRHPTTGLLLTISPDTYFSRLIASADFRFEGLRPQSFRRALVVIANPSGIDQYVVADQPLEPIQVAAERERARRGLGDLPCTELVTSGDATLNKLTDALRDGYDIFYLVCHGAMVEGRPYLWLETETGDVAVTAGDELVQRLSELQHRPRLIVLASCQSAGSGETTSSDEGALPFLGPLLAAMGIPAVVAMQGNITMTTLEEFMPSFFHEVQRDGQLDRAMMVARGNVRERLDSWMPVLFMRLKSGNIRWYQPGFAETKETLDNWPDLLSNLYEGTCTPILGSGLTEFLFGSRRELALRWADKYGFPMERHRREDLPQVAQFLAVTQSLGFPRRQLIKQFREEILRRYGHNLTEEEQHKELSELIKKFWEEQKNRNSAEPHKILAALPLPIYITTNPDNLLAEALKAAGKTPKTGLFWWNEDREPPDSLFAREPAYLPDKDRPLVYHFFGNLQEKNSLIVTEDDFFDYLIGLGRHSQIILPRVRRYLSDASLLFLGFQLDQWDFRVLFRSIMRLTGGSRFEDYPHVAVQIDPTESGPHKNEEVSKFLRKFFQNARISIFWGSVEDFTRQLRERWLETYRKDLGE